MYNVSLTSLNITAILIVVVLKWYLAKGILRPVYWLGIIGAIIFSCMNFMLFIHDTEQWSVMLLNILNAYGIIMNIIGLRRLKKESKL